MITKTYQAIGYQTYDMYVMLEGQRALISFRGGSLRPPINGTFQTTDPKLQSALAKDTARDLTFQEIGSFDDEAKEDEATSDVTKVDGIITVQRAREYLISNIEGMTQGSLPNRTAVLAIAAQHKIVFTDLK